MTYITSTEEWEKLERDKPMSLDDRKKQLFEFLSVLDIEEYQIIKDQAERFIKTPNGDIKEICTRYSLYVIAVSKSDYL